MILNLSEIDQQEYFHRRAKKQRRRALQQGKPASLTAVQWRFAFSWWGEKCAYCGGYPALTCDHFVPLGAPNSAGSIATNCLPSCERCNTSKQGHEPRQWVMDTFGDEGTNILAEIAAYFEAVYRRWHDLPKADI